MVREVGCDGRGLVGWHGEDVAESTTGVDDGLASFLGCGDAGAWDDLRRSNRGDVWAAQIRGQPAKFTEQEEMTRNFTYQVPGNDGLKVPDLPEL